MLLTIFIYNQNFTSNNFISAAYILNLIFKLVANQTLYHKKWFIFKQVNITSFILYYVNLIFQVAKYLLEVRGE